MLLRGAPSPSPAAVVFCDCPSVAGWFAAGIALGALLVLLSLAALWGLLRPIPAPTSVETRAAVEDDVFFDALEVVSVPRASYRRAR